MLTTELPGTLTDKIAKGTMVVAEESGQALSAATVIYFAILAVDAV